MSQATSWFSSHYDVFKDFQGIIGTFFGFLGVMLTLWWNSRKDINFHRWKLDQEKKSVAAAFKAELEAMVSPLETDMDNMSMGVGAFIAIPKELTKPTFFFSSADKVSLLDKETAGKVIRAYSFINEYPKLLFIAAHLINENDPFATQNTEGYYIVRSPRAVTAQPASRTVLPDRTARMAW